LKILKNKFEKRRCAPPTPLTGICVGQEIEEKKRKETNEEQIRD